MLLPSEYIAYVQKVKVRKYELEEVPFSQMEWDFIKQMASKYQCRHSDVIRAAIRKFQTFETEIVDNCPNRKI